MHKEEHMTAVGQRLRLYALTHRAGLRVLGLFLAFWLVWSQAAHIRDFFAGAFAGVSEAQQAHR